MNANSSKRGYNRPGAVLMTVLTVACFSAILLTAVLTFVNRAHTNAKNNYNSEQAYYIATSAIEGLNDYLQDPDNFQAILSYAGKEGTINFTSADGDAAMGDFIPNGDCKVKVTEMGDAGATSYIRVSVTGICNGQEETINAYYSVKTATRTAGIDNALYADGTASFGKSLATAGSLTTRDTYETSNNASSEGSVITGKDFYVKTQYAWTNNPTDSASSYIIVGHNIKTDNIPSFSPTTPKDDDNTSQYISVGGVAEFANSTTIGKQNKDASNNVTSVNEMDLYCSTLAIVSNAQLHLYGNAYIYKLDDFALMHNNTCGCGYYLGAGALSAEEAYNGSLIIDSSNTGSHVDGNAYIEGNIIFKSGFSGRKFAVNGTLYIAPTTQIYEGKVEWDPSVPPYGANVLKELANTVSHSGAINSGDGIFCDYLSAESIDDDTLVAWLKSGILKIRKDNNSYYDAANKNTDQVKDIIQQAKAAGRIKTEGITYGASGDRRTKPSTDFNDYQRSYETTKEFLANNPTINNAYTFAGTKNMRMYKLPSKKNDAFTGLDFWYEVATPGEYGCVIDSSSFVDGEFRNSNPSVLVLIDMNKINNNFVIRIKDASALSKIGFIIKNGVKDDWGNWTEQPVDYFCYFIYEEGQTATLDLDESIFIDYNTYKYVCKDKRAINLASYKNEKYAPNGYRDTNGVEHGVYSLSPARTYIMVHEGQTIALGDNTTFSSPSIPAIVEAVIYASKAHITSDGRGDSSILFLKDYNSTTVEGFPGGRRGSIFGAVVCETMQDGRETLGIAYVPPAQGSGVGGSGDAEDGGSITFSHYESR